MFIFPKQNSGCNKVFFYRARIFRNKFGFLCPLNPHRNDANQTKSSQLMIIILTTAQFWARNQIAFSRWVPKKSRYKSFLHISITWISIRNCVVFVGFFFIRSNHCQIRRSNNHHYKLTCHHWKSHGNETGGLKITTQYVVRRTFGVGLLRCSVHLFNWVPNVVLNFKIAILNLLSDKTEEYIEWTHHFTIQTQVISIWHEIQPNFQFEQSVYIWMSQCFPLLNNSNYHCTSGFCFA